MSKFDTRLSIHNHWSAFWRILGELIELGLTFKTRYSLRHLNDVLAICDELDELVTDLRELIVARKSDQHTWDKDRLPPD